MVGTGGQICRCVAGGTKIAEPGFFLFFCFFANLLVLFPPVDLKNKTKPFFW